MREVSSRVFDVKLRALRKRRISETVLLEGTNVTLDRLKNKSERVDWSDYVRIMRNAAKIWSDQQLVELGGAFLNSPIIRSMGVVPRLLFTARDIYEWVTKEGSGAGDAMFSCVRTTFKDIQPGELELSVELFEGYEYSREFFLLTMGSFIAFPKMLALPRSEVEMTPTERGAKFLVRYPLGGGKLAWLRKLFTYPFAARQVAKELKQSYEELQARFRELESAQSMLARQKRKLQTAHGINAVIRAELDLDRTLDASVRALVDAGGVQAVQLQLDVNFDERSICRNISVGAPGPEDEAIVVPLHAKGRTLGRLLAWEPRESSDNLDALLDLVAPAISVAVSDALAYGAVQDYRLNLERKVMERTVELVAARDELSETVAELERAQSARDRIFANINHEIRTPLTNVLLAIDALERRLGGRAPEAQSAVTSIQFNVQRLLRLVDGLLLLAAHQEGKLQVKRVSFDLASVLKQIVAAWAPNAELDGIHLAYDGPDYVAASLDAGAIEQVITNLVSNAMKFTKTGGAVTVRLRAVDRDLTIEVQDTGVGISDEFKRRIFGRFEQGAAPVQPGRRGSGIGLAIARELVEAHDGEIGVESLENKGSTFFVKLPGAGVESEISAKTIATRGSTPAPHMVAVARIIESTQAAKATILVAEDDPELLSSLGLLFSGEYRVLAAPDGYQALKLAAEHAPDLLVTDLEMPGMTGVELTEKFRAIPGLRLAPVLLLTAHGELGPRLDAFEKGAIDYVVKPFVPSELLARVRGQLALRDLALQLHQNEKLASLGLMLAGMAHELRNPANGLLNAVAPLRRALPAATIAEGTAAGEMLEVLELCAHQVASLARNLLNLDTGGDFVLEEVEPAVIVARAHRLCGPAFAGIELRQPSHFEGRLVCASVLMTQVMANLLENGAHAAGRGGWVSVESRREGDRLIIEVSDSGPGVPRALRERIFDPFYTTKPPNQGTGLGLTNVRRIAARHGGTIDVRDTANGSVFHLELPLGLETVSSPRTSTLSKSESRSRP